MNEAWYVYYCEGGRYGTGLSSFETKEQALSYISHRMKEIGRSDDRADRCNNSIHNYRLFKGEQYNIEISTVAETIKGDEIEIKLSSLRVVARMVEGEKS